MAHPDVVGDQFPKPEPFDRIDDPLGHKMILIVVSTADSVRLLGNTRVVDRQYASRPFDHQIPDAQLRLDWGRQQDRPSRLEVIRDKTDEHPCNVSRVDPLGIGRKRISAIEIIEIQFNSGCSPGADRIIP